MVARGEMGLFGVDALLRLVLKQSSGGRDIGEASLLGGIGSNEYAKLRPINYTLSRETLI